MNPNPATNTVRPYLLPARPPKPNALALWHLLSLDAPTVAVTWAAAADHAAGLPIPTLDLAALFLAVWMLYAADRLLDAQPLFTSSHPPELQPRHRFHHRHRRAFLRVIAAASLPLILLLHRTLPAVLHLDALLAILLLVWLLLVHARPAPSATSHRLPKELAVGLFFPAAIFIPTVARAPHLRPALLPLAILFAALCTLNCLFLYAWEHPPNSLRHHNINPHNNIVTYAHPSTRWAVRHLPPLAAALILTATLLALLPQALPQTPFLHQLPHPSLLPTATALSATLLLILHNRRHRLPALTLRALADLVLLTPLLLLLPH